MRQSAESRSEVFAGVSNDFLRVCGAFELAFGLAIDTLGILQCLCRV
jgi:hypothetical protein